MVCSRRPCGVGRHDDIAAGADRHRVDAFGKCHVGELRGEAIGTQIINHWRIEKPVCADEPRYSKNPGPELAFTYRVNNVGTRSSLVRAGKRDSDTDRNRMGIDLAQRKPCHQATETVCVDIDRNARLGNGDLSQQLTERFSRRSNAYEGVRAVVMRRLERQ